jgi:hypothetical protein
MHLLMKCAVVANAAAESVNQAENELVFNQLTRIAAYSKKSYDTLFEQLQYVSDQSKPPNNSPNFITKFRDLPVLWRQHGPLWYQR